MKKKFWTTCIAGNAKKFNAIIKEIKLITEADHKYLMDIPLRNWVKHAFIAKAKYAHVTNNISESFNNWINQYKGLLITKLFEEIRRGTMRLIH